MCVDIVESSHSQSASIDDKITLRCRSTPGNTVSWFFHQSPDSPLEEIYVNGAISEPWMSHFMIGSLQSGDYNLVILSAIHNDTGLYYCVKHHVNAPIVFTNLTVSSGILISLFV